MPAMQSKRQYGKSDNWVPNGYHERPKARPRPFKVAKVDTASIAELSPKWSCRILKSDDTATIRTIVRVVENYNSRIHSSIPYSKVKRVSQRYIVPPRISHESSGKRDHTQAKQNRRANAQEPREVRFTLHRCLDLFNGVNRTKGTS